MTRAEALRAVIDLLGGQQIGTSTFRFQGLEAADHAKAVLDALTPGCSGAVFFDGRLMVDIA